MISSFNEWASSSQLIETAEFEQLRGRILGIEAEDYIDSMLTSPASKEPLLPALGGLPFAIDSVVEGHLSLLDKAGIKPLFVFSGLRFNDPDEKLQADLKAAKSVGAAWDLYGASEPERAVTEFGNTCTISRMLFERSKDLLIPVQARSG